MIFNREDILWAEAAIETILYHDLMRWPGAEDKYGAVFRSKDRLLAESDFRVVSADLRCCSAAPYTKIAGKSNSRA